MNYKQTFHNTLVVAAMFSFFHAGESAAAVQYSVSDLGSLGGSYSLGLGINEIDEVIGLSYGIDNTVNQTFLYGAAGIAQPLGLLLGGSYSQGMDINNFHQVTGQASLPGDLVYHAFVWENAQPYDLGTLDLLTGTGTSLGIGINDNQQIAGYSTVNGGTAIHAVVWTKNATNWKINDIGTLDQVAGTGNSQANGLNETGQVTGFSTVSGSSAQHAVVWTKGLTNWTAMDLGTLGGTYSAGFAINSNGEVTGSATTVLDAQQHAFIAQSTQSPPIMTDLKTLGGTFSEGYSINLAGDVVGYSTTLGDLKQVAFLWQNTTGMQDLNTLIDPASGWTLLEAHAISDKGHITGIGLRNGEKHAFLLTKLITDTTPPLVSFQVTPAAPGVSGWYVTSPSVAWSVSDPESAVSSKVGCTAVPLVADTTGQSFSCAATSAGGTTGSITTPVLKVDTVQPVLSGVPAAFTQAATSTTGAPVNYTLPSASDSTSGINPAGVSCSPASGSAFPMGATTVNCSVQDNAGNSNNASFVVTVADLTPPVITPTVTGIIGQNGWYTGPVSVSWNVADNETAVTATTGCTATSTAINGAGQVFSCTATSGGGTATVSTQAINIDTQAPSFLSCPATVTLTQGQSLPQPSATDNLTIPTVSGAPGSLPLGTTTVTWKATDQAGLSSNCVQQVTVTAAISETIGITKSQCKRINTASGEWLVQGTSTNSTSNSIQLYTTASVPADLASNKLGAAVPVAKGSWQLQLKPGPACTAPISLRSTATGTKLENISVNIQ